MEKRPPRSLEPATADSARTAAIREFGYTDADFEKARKLIYQHAGISLSEHKRDMVYSRLGRRLRALGLKRFDAYLAHLEQSNDPVEWEAFVNALTTNLTSFFREAHHFPILTEHLNQCRSRPIRIWCSAASTGEEPYSIAMTVVEALGSFQAPVRIVCSDLDTNVLKTAATGVYPIDRVSRLTERQLKQFFLRGSGENEGFVKVRPELRKMLEFRQVNLLHKSYGIEGPLDILFCRNVMIYFDKPTQREILSRFAPLMHPEGLLFAGHSESFLHAADLFKSLGKTVYAVNRPK